MHKTIRWGILGCGKIAHKFANDLAMSKSGILVACASRDQEKANAFAALYDAKQVFTTYESLAKCPYIDIIYIATPHSHHHQHAILCMEENKAVLCEKPLAINANEVEDMLRFASKKNVFLMEALWTGLLLNIIEVNQKVKDGVIGEVRHLSADFGFQSNFDPDGRLFSPLLAGGSILDIGIYPIFMSILILGIPESIVAKAHKSITGVDDECTILLTYANGATASLYSSLTVNTKTQCEIFGTKGNITIPTRFHEQMTYTLTLNDCKPITQTTDRQGYGYYHQIEHVHDCLLQNLKQSPIISHEMSRLLISIMDEARRQIGLKYPME